MLNTVKNALRLRTNIYDSAITALISAALADLGITDIDKNLLVSTTTDALIIQAVITYCRCHFGSPDDYERLKASYDEQKAQLLMATGYGFTYEVDYASC